MNLIHIPAAQTIAQETLRPHATEVDQGDHLPTQHWTALRDADLFSTVQADDPLRTTLAVGEILVAACLTTGFVWAQHQGALLTLLRTDSSRASALLSGAQQGGVCYAGLQSHGETLRIEDGTLVGFAPFVTGWLTLDILVLWASDTTTDEIVCYAVDTPSHLHNIEVSELSLIAANASQTVGVTFDHTPLAGAIELARKPRKDGAHIPILTRRQNATLALGVCTGISADLRDADIATDTTARLDKIRHDLDAAARDTDTARMTRARGQLLATTTVAAQQLYLGLGSKSADTTQIGNRRVREAAFVQAAATLVDERSYARRALHADTSGTTTK